MKNNAKQAGQEFEKKAREWGEKAKNNDNWDSFKNMGKGQNINNEWFKKT